MGYQLCVAEKPGVAKDIARVVGASNKFKGFFEGNGFLVTWALGHLVSLAEPADYGFVALPDIFTDSRDKAYSELPLIPEVFKYVVIGSTRGQFYIIRELFNRSDVDRVIDCGDMGAEGHILQWLIREKAGCKKPVVRFCATSMTDEAIKRAMCNLRPIEEFDNIIKGELCKKKADWILGMSMSRALSIKYRAGINVGRVQSPTLYFVVQRFLEVSSFKVSEYYTMRAGLRDGFSVFWNKDSSAPPYFPPNVKDGYCRVVDKPSIDHIAGRILSGGVGVVSEVTSLTKAVNRPQLYDITELQRDANKIYGYTAIATLATAQSLYENHKILSYPRTDSRYITSDLIPYVGKYMTSIGNIERYKPCVSYLLSSTLNFDNRVVDDKKVTDHHAIIVTDNISRIGSMSFFPTKEENEKGVTADSLKNILDLVIARMIVALSQPYIYESTVVKVSFPIGITFEAAGAVPRHMGWKILQGMLFGKNPESPAGESDPEQKFPTLKKGQAVSVESCDTIAKKTAPPLLHTEATLLSAMEHAGARLDGGAVLAGKGLGTQATRAEIIKKLFDCGVVEGQKKGKHTYIKPTDKGIGVIGVMPEELYSPKITADWEATIADIAAGAADESVFMGEFIPFIKNKVDEVRRSDISFKFMRIRESHGICPWCGADVYRYENKGDEVSGDYFRYYCSSGCGFELKTNDKMFRLFLNRGLTAAEARRLISKGMLTVDVAKKNAIGTYRREFCFSKRDTGSKTYCNVTSSPVSMR